MAEKPKERNRERDRKFKRKRKVCVFCADKMAVADYKNVDFVKRFISDRGKILPRRSSGCCAKHQRLVMKMVKKARHIALVPYTVE